MRRTLAFPILIIGLLFPSVILPHWKAGQQGTCTGAPPTQLAVGEQIEVTPLQPGEVATPVRIHAQPSTSVDVIGQLNSGDRASIIGGPQCADGYLWWQVQLDSGLMGWVAEGTTDRYFIDPVNGTPGTPTATPEPTIGIVPFNCPNAPPTEFAVGFRGLVRPAIAGATPNNVRIRDTASTSGKLIGNLPENVLFTVIGGPVCANGYVWWQIKADNGLTGWTAEGDTQKYYIVPISYTFTPTPAPTNAVIVIPLNCPSAPPSRFMGGMQGVVTRDNGVRLHTDWDVNSPLVISQDKAGHKFDGLMSKGTIFTVMDDPQCNQAYTWLQIMFTSSVQQPDGSYNLTGYIAENGDDGLYNVDPVTPYITATPEGTPALPTLQPTAAISYPTQQPTSTP